MKSIFSLLFICLFLNAVSVSAQPTLEQKISEMEKYEGFFTYWWDEEAGKIWLEIDKLDEELLYVNSLAAGMGSNDIGLDRSQLGDTRVVEFRKIGPKVLLIQPNYNFRAGSDNPLEQKSVEEAFATSVLWGFEAELQENGKILIDVTEFLLRDAHDVTGRLKNNGQGNFILDEDRSAIHLPGTFNFPKNSEFEAILTFEGEDPGSNVQSVTPTPEAITLRQHHSFVELPDDNYQPREFDPRAGYFGISYQDYSVPIGDELTKRYIARHRLKKKNPAADVSEPVEPIVYYLDNGTPEPIRTALLDGARWWAEAFEEIGYKDAFRVEILPDDVHPLDVRYNVINWVHRSTRGWSYGSSVTDPRTGEIIKGNVLLGSLRVRQDYMIAEGILAPYEEGKEPDPQMLEMALDRIRQLSAHEIGHTLGIAHNFAASANDLASVMDYPHPMVSILDDGSLSLENAYDTGIGEWDKRAIAYGYQDFPENVNEGNKLNQILEETFDLGLLYISDEAARPESGAHPYAHLWEYGENAAEQLSHILDIREIALSGFGEKNVRQGRPMANLEDVLVPVYLFHRYQTEAAVKLIGGVNYSYTIRGDRQEGPRIVDPQKQEEALEAILKTLAAETLALPESLLELIPPRPPGFSETREHFQGYTDPVPDHVAMAEMAADHTSGLLFNAERAARLANQHSRNSDMPGLKGLMQRVIDFTLLSESKPGYTGSVQRGINIAVLRNVLQLAAENEAAPDVQAITGLMIENLEQDLHQKKEETDGFTWKAHYRQMAGMIEKFRNDPDSYSPPSSPYTPPGSPIGNDRFMTPASFCSY